MRFKQLAKLTAKLSKSLHRMLSPKGKPSMYKCAAIFGAVREVIYRLEAGEESTVTSLFAVMGALGLVMRVEHAGLPTASEVAARFMEDDDAS